MSDARLRELERRWRQGGSVADPSFFGMAPGMIHQLVPDGSRHGLNWDALARGLLEPEHVTA